jgi:hypothetical protein
LRRNDIIGHQLVKALWKRLRPTNAVKAKNQGLTNQPSASETTTKKPAMALSHC